MREYTNQSLERELAEEKSKNQKLEKDLEELKKREVNYRKNAVKIIKDNLIMIGNRCVGRSTLLNGPVNNVKFRSVVNLGEDSPTSWKSTFTNNAAILIPQVSQTSR